jgi:hypothetical protein
VKALGQHQASNFNSPWAVDDFLHFSDLESSDKKGQMEFGELEWLSDMGIFEEQLEHEATLAAAEVPQLPVSYSGHASSNRSAKYNMVNKRPRIDQLDDEDEFFTVPDLG